MRCNWLAGYGVVAMLAIGCIGLGSNCYATDDSSATVVDTPPKSEFDATHTEVNPLVPKHNGAAGQLHTFKLTPDGHIVAGVTFDRNYLQVYSPNLELVREIPIDFPATAISIEPSGTYLIGGGGQIARLSTSGEVLKSSPAPHMAGQSAEEAKEKMIVEYKKQMEQTREIYNQQIEQIQKQIDKLTKKQEEKGDDFSKRDQSRLDSLKEQLTQYQSIVEQQFSVEIDAETLKYMLESQTRIPSLATSGEDVFVAVSTGRGYEIWRVDTNFENATKVIEDLSGCCGQFDFYAANGHLFLAENTKFQVGIYDRDGKHLNGFGERAGSSEAGFGSCCNPMNVVCTSSGEILTAESSIGKIKRFNQAGELVGVVGKARIGGGCKHVALGLDESRNRYYVQYQDKNSICVLIPNAEAEVVMAESNKNRQAAAAEVVKLAGRWERVKGEAKVEKTEKPAASELGGVIVGNDGETFSMEEYMAARTDFQFLTFDAATKKLQCEFAAANGQQAGVINLLFGGGESGERAPVNYLTVPQSFVDGKIQMDLEDESGLIAFEMQAKLEGETLIVTFVDPYSPNLKPLTFKRAAEPTSTKSGE
ncbi:MAG: hypothetical protein JNL67_07030 [Planctomycetaceae bacterium]|nr:hypothetical protein [Planctomycetaceae bacterium]